MNTIRSIGLFFSACLMACAAYPHSTPTAPKPSVAVPAANDASLHPGGEVAESPRIFKVEPATDENVAKWNKANKDNEYRQLSGPTQYGPQDDVQVAAAVPTAPVQSPALAPAHTSGHYELRSRRVGIGRWQNYQVWVPNQQPVRYQYGGGCSSGRCGR